MARRLRWPCIPPPLLFPPRDPVCVTATPVTTPGLFSLPPPPGVMVAVAPSGLLIAATPPYPPMYSAPVYQGTQPTAPPPCAGACGDVTGEDAGAIINAAVAGGGGSKAPGKMHSPPAPRDPPGDRCCRALSPAVSDLRRWMSMSSTCAMPTLTRAIYARRPIGKAPS